MERPKRRRGDLLRFEIFFFSIGHYFMGIARSFDTTISRFGCP
jgi:hypothetical protein